MKGILGGTRFRDARSRQRLFPFQDRRRRIERIVKRWIVGGTLAALAGLLLTLPAGRDAIRASPKVKWWTMRRIGLEPATAEVRGVADAEWRSRRALGVLEARRQIREMADRAEPKVKTFLEAAGLTPEQAVVRWGNYTKTLLLSGKLFEEDDSGRSYRMKPDVKSVWLREVSLGSGFEGTLQIPDTPEAREAGREIGAVLVADSVSTTNDWGCRGPAWDASAEVRGLVLGDSFMVGMLLGDDQTPPRHLEKHLHKFLNKSVSILNTGHVGYSPEQYYWTFREFFDRVKPDFVVTALFVNDFGEDMDRLDWDDASYWLGKIQHDCRERDVLCILSPIPMEQQIKKVRREDKYPAPLTRHTDTNGLHYLNPIEAFVNEHLRLMQATSRRPENSPLFNGHLRDGHFSPLGADLWGRILADRLALLLSQRAARGK